MKILLYNCETHFLFLDDFVTVLEIENPKVFCGIMYDVFNSDFPAKEIAIENGDELLKTKDFLVISDVFNLELTNKTILNKLYKYLDKYINEHTMLRLKFDDAYLNFGNSISSLLNDIDIDFDWSPSCEIKDSLSMINLELLDQDNNLVDKLLQYIKLIAELKLCKVLFLVNIKSFLNNDEILLIYKQSLYYKTALVLLESKHSETLLQYEQKIFTDKYFCDILIK